MKGSCKEKRACERIPANIAVRFFCVTLLNAVYYGTVNNISEKGMLIKTETCFPRNTDIRLFIYKEKIMQVDAKVKRGIRTEGLYAAMGIEIINSDEDYFQFISSLKRETIKSGNI